MDNTPTHRPRRKYYVPVEEFLQRTATALTNAGDPEILPLLERRRISATVLAARQAEADTLRKLAEKQRKEYGEQYKATDDYEEAHDAAYEDYMDHIELARIVFREDAGAKTALGLRGHRAASQSGFIGQGLLFYNGSLANEGYADALSGTGIDANELRAGQATFKRLQELAAAQTKETGEAQEATQKRDAAYDALQKWMADFYKTAKVALRKYPQMRERLGMVEES